jgi:hypothetical protein
MKKIGIVTLFGYNNYGNRLQMYAVHKVYKRMGLDSEVIRYHKEIPKERFVIRLKILVISMLSLKSHLATSSLKKQRVSNFEKHAKTHYTESESYVNPLAIGSDFHDNYSFFSVGSDQIWGEWNFDISDFIFLKFAPLEKRIAFSPSFGSSMIDEKYRKIFTDGLKGFHNLSVREATGAKIVKDFTDKEATVLCDPTMCVSKTEWLSFSNIHKGKPTGKFILTYFLGEKSQKVLNIISQLSKEYEIVELNSLESPKLYAVTPSEWVDYINSASLFLTDSFHGVVFSIIMQTPFAVYSRVGGESMQTRITNILEKFKMENRFEIATMDANLFHMDFSGAEENINMEKSKVMAFLEKSLHL